MSPRASVQSPFPEGVCRWNSHSLPPSRWLSDTTGFLSPQTRQSLDARLQDFARATGHQVIVYIGDTTGGVPIEDWAVRAFKAWRVGRKGLDDGLVLFIMTRDRTLHIEVGYGLEAVLPDAIASRIIRETLVPAIQAGNNDAAVEGGVNAILSVLTGGSANAPLPNESYRKSLPQRQAPGQAPSQHQSPGLIQMIFMGIIALVFLYLFATNPWLAIYLLSSFMSGGRGSGGGGFSGGGGKIGRRGGIGIVVIWPRDAYLERGIDL